jgi:hypothetical protein
MRYPKGKVYFDIPEIKAFRFKAMAILVGFYTGEYPKRYKGQLSKERVEQYAQDINVLNTLNEVKNKYKLAFNNFIYMSKNRKFMEKEYWSDIVFIESTYIAHYTFINKTQILPLNICYSNDVRATVKYADYLINSIQKEKNTHQNKLIYRRFNEKHSNIPTVFKLLQYRCPNLNPEITQIVQKVEQLNKQLNKKDK